METRSLTTDHWYARNGERFPANAIFPNQLRQLIVGNGTLQNTGNRTPYPNPPRPIFGFLPDNGDTDANGFARLTDGNSPYNVNSMFLPCIGQPVNNEAITRQGIEINSTSFYINGTISKPTCAIPLNQAVTSDYQLSTIRNNQVIMAIINENCRVPNSADTDWTKILDLNTTPTLEFNDVTSGANWNNTDPILKTRNYPEFPNTITTGVDRFTAPNVTLNTDSRTQFKILATKLYDLDTNNTLFTIDTYLKLEMKPFAAAKYKQKIKVVFVTGTTACLLQECLKNAIHVVFLTHGMYKNSLATSAPLPDGRNISKTGTTLSSTVGNTPNASPQYWDLSKIYPTMTFTAKFNFKDC